MFSFTKPEKLNGNQLKEELLVKGIELFDMPYIDGDGTLWLDIEAEKVAAAESVVKKHIGQDNPNSLSVEEKLASVGLNLEDLKTALGL